MDQTGRWQHSLQTPSPLLFFAISYRELLSLPFWQLSCTSPTLFPTFTNKNAASNLVYICSRCQGLQEHLCLSSAHLVQLCRTSLHHLYFFQISASFLLKLNCAKSLVHQYKHSHINHQYFYSVASLAGPWWYSNKHPSNK